MPEGKAAAIAAASQSGDPEAMPPNDGWSPIRMRGCAHTAAWSAAESPAQSRGWVQIRPPEPGPILTPGTGCSGRTLRLDPKPSCQSRARHAAGAETASATGRVTATRNRCCVVDPHAVAVGSQAIAGRARTIATERAFLSRADRRRRSATSLRWPEPRGHQECRGQSSARRSSPDEPRPSPVFRAGWTMHRGRGANEFGPPGSPATSGCEAIAEIRLAGGDR